MTRREISIRMPTRSGEFLDRQCPTCDRRFEIDHQQFEELCYLNLRCPYCEWIEEVEGFLTEEQAVFLRSTAEAEGTQLAEEAVNDLMDGLFEDLEQNDVIEVTSSNDVEFSGPRIPSPASDVETERRTCSECGFRFSVVDTESDIAPSCPVCRI